MAYCPEHDVTYRGECWRCPEGESVPEWPTPLVGGRVKLVAWALTITGSILVLVVWPLTIWAWTFIVGLVLTFSGVILHPPDQDATGRG